ncbi:MAG: hypothetical protein ACKO3B_13450, partial [Bacteroidota bacterium]
MKLLITILVLCGLTVFSQEKKEDVKPIPEAKSFTTKHQLTAGGKLIRYEAIAAETYLKKDGEPVASIWSVTYKHTAETCISRNKESSFQLQVEFKVT